VHKYIVEANQIMEGLKCAQSSLGCTTEDGRSRRCATEGSRSERRATRGGGSWQRATRVSGVVDGAQALGADLSNA
jgi:hypothetical protein